MPVTSTRFNLEASNYNAQRQEKVDALSPKAKRLPTWVKPVAYTALTIAGLAAIYFAGPVIFSSSTPVPTPTPTPTPKSPAPTPTPTPTPTPKAQTPTPTSMPKTTAPTQPPTPPPTPNSPTPIPIPTPT